jgi:hypothetical protein
MTVQNSWKNAENNRVPILSTMMAAPLLSKVYLFKKLCKMLIVFKGGAKPSDFNSTDFFQTLEKSEEDFTIGSFPFIHHTLPSINPKI